MRGLQRLAGGCFPPPSTFYSFHQIFPTVSPISTSGWFSPAFLLPSFSQGSWCPSEPGRVRPTPVRAPLPPLSRSSPSLSKGSAVSAGQTLRQCCVPCSVWSRAVTSPLSPWGNRRSWRPRTEAAMWSSFSGGAAFAHFHRRPPHAPSLCLPTSEMAVGLPREGRPHPSSGQGPRTSRRRHSGSGSWSAPGHTAFVRFELGGSPPPAGLVTVPGAGSEPWDEETPVPPALATLRLPLSTRHTDGKTDEGLQSRLRLSPCAPQGAALRREPRPLRRSAQLSSARAPLVPSAMATPGCCFLPLSLTSGCQATSASHGSGHL